MNITKRQAIAEVRAEANWIIDQLERRAKGWDKGAYRSDDTMRHRTIDQMLGYASAHCFALSQAFSA